MVTVFLALTQAVVKAMDQLAQEGKIKEKVYGKQKIYFADQVGVIPHIIQLDGGFTVL